MAGIWPNLDQSDLELRARTYLNEVAAGYYTDAEIDTWVSLGLKELAQASTGIRRILSVQATSSSRTISHNVYKVHHVEYIPSSGPPIMLSQISPLQVGHYPLNGTQPQYWYEQGSTIGIEPIPDATYNLRLYVSDMPHVQWATAYPITTFTSGASWTATGTGTWTKSSTNAVYAGTTGQAGILTSSAIVSAGYYHILTFTVSSLSNCTLTIKAGTATSPTISTNGTHTVKLLATSTPVIVFTATMTGASGGVTVSNLYVSMESDLSNDSDQTTAPPYMQLLSALYATSLGLKKTGRLPQAQMLDSIILSEITWLRQTIIDILPNGKSELTEK